tara:strand:+ start:5514 stop:6050 length:537 start_codon:yes stop_codon:yes gene_type:complete
MMIWTDPLKLFLCAVLMSVIGAVTPARADTTADCGRFYLKYNEQTKRMECVGKGRSSGTAANALQSLARQLDRQVRQLQQALDGAEAILAGRELRQDAEQRVGQLLNEAENRTREIRQTSREISQAQRSRTNELAAEQRQVVQAQSQLARELDQKQRALTQQLVAEQRARTQTLLRGN